MTRYECDECGQIYVSDEDKNNTRCCDCGGQLYESQR